MDYAFDPELRAIVSLLPRLDLTDIPAVRAVLRQMRAVVPQSPPSSVSVERRVVPGPLGAPDVEIRIITPYQPAPRPAVLWLHGGGFVMGDVDGDLGTVTNIATEVGAVMVSVAYRLAPEHPYPAALEDSFAALSWLADHAVELGVDPERIAIGGISSGAGLAAALALWTRDRGGPRVCFQLLETPVVDDRCDTASMRRFTDTPLWTRGNAILSWDAYLGPLRSGAVPGYAAAARADDLGGLPPAYVVTCEFDPLRDEGIGYAHRLMGAGVPVELHHYPGTFHGCPGAGVGTTIAGRMVQDRLVAVRRALAGR
jgi:acetyl esterase/lipase